MPDEHEECLTDCVAALQAYMRENYLSIYSEQDKWVNIYCSKHNVTHEITLDRN